MLLKEQKTNNQIAFYSSIYLIVLVWKLISVNAIVINHIYNILNDEFVLMFFMLYNLN